MFVTIRRGPASSIAKCFRLPSTSSTTSHLALSWKNPYLVPRLLSNDLTFRAFNTVSSCRQEAAARARQDSRSADASDYQSSQKPARAQAQYGPVTRFAELGERNMVVPTVVKTITQGMKLDTMTHVQSLTINETLKGGDVIAQARTGTGKTLAFLIPVLQNIIKVDPKLEYPRSYSRDRRSVPLDIRALIISPTRELAEQIAVEARKLTSGTGVVVQTAVGGTQKRDGLNKIHREGCHILVGTPGRLQDLFSDPYSNIKAPNLTALVLDEADRLLDQGFAQAIEDIERLLPRRAETDRQTLLFSATVPAEVMHMVRRTMKPDFKFVRTVQEGEQETHEKVPQKLVFTSGFENLMPTLVELCKKEKAKLDGEPFKAIVYFGATAEVALAASTFAKLQAPGSSSPYGKNPLYPASIIEIHSRLTQSQRTRAASTFRNSRSGILLSSDVTARGMDFPNVTHVIQVGLPPNREAYVHRIGRTARGDKGGEGWLIITDLEKSEARQRLRSLPLVLDTSLEIARIDMSQDAQLSASTAETLTQTIEASKQVDPSLKVSAHLAALGLFQWLPSKQSLIDSLNARVKYCWAMDEPPRISRMLASKLGLLRLQGVVIGSNSTPGWEGDRGGESSGGFRRSSFGGSHDSSFGRGRREGGGGFDGGRGRTGGGFGRSFGGGFGGGSRGGFGGGSGDSSEGGSEDGSGGSYSGGSGGFGRERRSFGQSDRSGRFGASGRDRFGGDRGGRREGGGYIRSGRGGEESD